jgi:hypothetical protein
MQGGDGLTQGQRRFLSCMRDRLVRQGGDGYMRGARGDDVYVYTDENGRVVRHQVNSKGEVVGRVSFVR